MSRSGYSDDLDQGAEMSDDIRTEARSLLDGIPSWGDGANWCDPSGQSIPIPKVTLRRLLNYILTDVEALLAERARPATDSGIKSEVLLIRADLLDLLKVCGIDPAGVMSFQDDLLAVTRYVRGLQDVVMAGPQRERTDIAAWLRRDSTAETEPAAWSYAAAIENGAHLALKPRG